MASDAATVVVPPAPTVLLPPWLELFLLSVFELELGARLNCVLLLVDKFVLLKPVVELAACFGDSWFSFRTVSLCSIFSVFAERIKNCFQIFI